MASALSSGPEFFNDVRERTSRLVRQQQGVRDYISVLVNAVRGSAAGPALEKQAIRTGYTLEYAAEVCALIDMLTIMAEARDVSPQMIFIEGMDLPASWARHDVETVVAGPIEVGRALTKLVDLMDPVAARLVARLAYDGIQDVTLALSSHRAVTVGYIQSTSSSLENW